MEQDERKTKLKAGKDALLAYQRRKGKRSKKKTLLDEGNSLASDGSFGELPSFTDSLSLSASASIDTSGVGPSVKSGSNSPLHFNDRDHPIHDITNSSSKLPHAMPPVSAEVPTFNNHPGGVRTGHSLHTFDTGVINDFQNHLNSSTSNESDLVSNSSLRDYGELVPSTHLVEKVAKLQEERDKLEIELTTLRDSQNAAFDKGKQMMADHYQSQLSQAESALQSREREIKQLGLSHAAELDRIARQQAQLREEERREKDQKHAAHIARLTEQLSRQENMAGNFVQEDEEREAGRIRQIKEKLKEMHEEEKERLLVSHQQEKQMLFQEHERQKELMRIECQRTLEENQCKLEELANQQVAQLHAQYVAAHKLVTDKNESLEVELSSIQNQLADLRVATQRLEQEKKVAEERLNELCRSHSLEIQSIKQDSSDLEQRLLDWRNKADNLKTRLEQSSQEEVQEEYVRQLESQQATIQTLENQIKRLNADHAQSMERREESIKTVYSAQLKSKQSTIEELENQLRAAEQEHTQNLAELRKQHQVELTEVRSQHSNEISLLEESMTEQSSSKASLEFAEAHMKEMQQQLNAYRNQETNHRTEMEANKKEHLRKMEELRESLDLYHSRQLDDSQQKHTTALQLLHKQVFDLQSQLEVQEASHGQVVETELETLQSTMRTDWEQRLKEVELAHTQAEDEMRQNHQMELLETKEELQHQLQVEIEALQDRLCAEKAREVEELRAENQAALTRLKDSFAATGEEALTEAQKRVVDLEEQLRDIENTAKESRKLQELYQKLQTELTARKVDLSITQSTLNEEKKTLEDSRAKVQELSDMISQLQQSEQSLNEELDGQGKHLGQLLQDKEDELATLEAHNQTLQAQVLDLTSELEEERERVKHDMLNSQREASELSEQQLSEIQSVHVQLESAKRKYSNLMDEWTKKEQDAVTLQSKLASTKENLSACESRWSAKYADLVSQSSRDIQSLKQQLAEESSSLTDTSQVLQQAREQVSSLENQNGQQKATIAELSDRTRALSDELGAMQKAKSSAEQHLTESLEEIGKLRNAREAEECLKTEVEELQSRLCSLESKHSVVCLERSKLKEQVNILQTQLPSLNGEVDSLNKATQDQEQVIADLKTQLTARENTFVKAQKEFAQKLALAELKQQSLQQQIRESKKANELLGSVVNRKSDLERSLSRARQSLMDKLREKGHLEKELNFQQVELERRQSEKQRLEDVLMEKSRFEQELRSQKEQLATELETIERKLQMHESELSGERADMSLNARERDGLLLLSEYVSARPAPEDECQQPTSPFSKNSSMDSLESEH